LAGALLQTPLGSLQHSQTPYLYLKGGGKRKEKEKKVQVKEGRKRQGRKCRVPPSTSE